MASNINADNGVVSGSAGLKTSADSSGVLALQTNGTTAVTIDTSQNATFNSTGSLTLPSGTTAQRPSTPVVGMSRYNTTTGNPEWYSTNGWTNFSDPTAYFVEYIAIAGGGGGGIDGGGGGGAGGLLYGLTSPIAVGTTVSIIIGAGGVAATGYGTQPQSGSNTTLSTGITAIAIGGGGASLVSSAPYNVTNALNGGSGGGSMGSAGNAANGGSGTSGQGFAGGNGFSGAIWDGAGGGGAGGVGAPNGSNNGGAGGIGSNTYSTWASATSTGVSGYYAGGGGGASEGGTPGAGGLGGGGAGATGGTYGIAGTVNTGGGAGGSDGTSTGGGSGGSGLCIIRYQSTYQKGTGGTVTSSGGYWYHTFTTSGTFIA